MGKSRAGRNAVIGIMVAALAVFGYGAFVNPNFLSQLAAGAVTGTVTYTVNTIDSNNNPVPNVIVYLYGPGCVTQLSCSGNAYLATSNSTGQAKFNIPSGVYFIKSGDPNYIATNYSWNNNVAAGAYSLIVLQNAFAVTVRDQLNNPVGGASVTMSGPNYPNLIVNTVTRITDGGGSAKFLAGELGYSVSPFVGYLTDQLTVTFGAIQNRQVLTLTVGSNGILSPSAVTINLPITAPRLNSILLTASSSSVTPGTVETFQATATDSTGALMSGITVNFNSNNANIGQAVTGSNGIATLSIPMNTAGTFSITAVSGSVTSNPLAITVAGTPTIAFNWWIIAFAVTGVVTPSYAYATRKR